MHNKEAIEEKWASWSSRQKKTITVQMPQSISPTICKTAQRQASKLLEQDLNIIELLWGDIKRAVHARQPSKLQELETFCQEELVALPSENIKNLIHNYHKRLQVVIDLCLCDMSDQERSVAHGELVGVHLLMEDILQEKYRFSSFNVEGNLETKQLQTELFPLGEKQSLKIESKLESEAQDPVSESTLLKSFLILWKQLEYFKEQWGKHKLQVEEIDTVGLYRQFCELYSLLTSKITMAQSTSRGLTVQEIEVIIFNSDEDNDISLSDEEYIPPANVSTSSSSDSSDDEEVMDPAECAKTTNTCWRPNCREIPPIMKHNAQRPIYESVFGFCNEATMVSYKAKKEKSVILLSTMHHDESIDTNDRKQKPEIILHYNKTKGGVDKMDEMITEYSLRI
ncbi:unnamed protein product [Ranitomeya imitator]|uniref:PiggyBac transposable element-derived protein domain-containing protein n=1 Tax=Ranitomeya imitator TaxID=111125 RepID=A0ABN9LIS8_9NEOB|nr:unnamed protein product [Ranitomeya imitator]